MRDAGINVGIGTDGTTSSDNLNMFEAMRIASMVSHVQSVDTARWLSAEEVFDAATIGSARALGMERVIGQIAPASRPTWCSSTCTPCTGCRSTTWSGS